MKYCCDCKQTKELTEFPKNKSTKDGLHPHCRTCCSIRGKNYYQKNTQKTKEAHKKYYELNKARLYEKTKQYLQTDRGRFQHCRAYAKHNKIEWLLTFEEFLTYKNKPCTYCGDFFESRSGVGLDRVDSSGGYKVQNVTPCCARCNYLFLDYDKEEQYKHIAKVLANRSKT